MWQEDDGHEIDGFCEGEDDEFEEFGCLYGADCCMPGLHFPSECHTGEMLEAQYKEMERETSLFWRIVSKLYKFKEAIYWGYWYRFRCWLTRFESKDDLPF